MKSLRKSLLITTYLGFSLLAMGQENTVSYNLKKGEAFDILLVTSRPNGKETMKAYREKAFPVAVEMGYSFLPGFKITETTQGNYQPEGIIFGKWKSLATREAFLEDIDTKVPTFHQMRKKIWSLFNVTYYDLQEDISFELDPKKVIVATAYWKKDNTSVDFKDFITKWKNTLKSSSGTIKIELTDGRSPFGYYYNPDYLAISEWDTRDDFETFLKLNLKMDTQALKNINQFILDK